MKSFKLYTEHRDNLIELARFYFNEFTVYNKTGNDSIVGLWNNEIEQTSIIEIIMNDTIINESLICKLINDIKRVNNQQMVLLTITDMEVIYG